jgi:hypothetical protein
LLVPLTVAVYCTVLAEDGVLTFTEAGDTGKDATVTRICCWPLLGAWAIQPAKGSRTAEMTKQETAEDKKFRTGPSDSQKAIKRMFGEGTGSGLRDGHLVMLDSACQP